MAFSEAPTDDQCRDAHLAVTQHKTLTEAAQSIGITVPKLKHRDKLYNERRLGEKPALEADEIEFPDLPSSELPAEQLIEQACKRFESHLNARDARRWMEIKIKSNKPMAVCFMGDPHVDNNGCNWPLLRRDIGILEKTDGLFAVNIGDLTDNWVGRLVRLYADQEMSKKQAWKLAKYLLKDCDIKWLCHILGNHDAWNDGPYLIKANARPTVPVEDWQSRFQLVYPNGSRVRIHAAHDFPGSSIWNKMHGPQKASMLLEEADIFACGHKHEWAVNQSENAQRGFIYHLIRARGYKFIDSYADQLGYPSQKFGASITAVIDPSIEGPRRINCFADLEEGADFLKFKRARA
jgi:hypothetical protein